MPLDILSRELQVSAARLSQWPEAFVPSLAKCGPPPWPSDSELVTAIRTFIADSEFFGEGYRKVHAALRFNGLRTSPQICFHYIIRFNLKF
jgi:hypothetical protein